MAIRSAPQQSILDCLPTAVEIADLRIINKDLNFIQANIKRADDLSIEAMNATDYSQLVSITEKFSKLCLLYTSPSPRDGLLSRMPSSA